MNISKFGFLHESSRISALELLDQVEHMIVGPAREEDLASVQFVESAADRPHVQRTVIRQAKDCTR